MQLLLGDCLEKLKEIEPCSVDMVLADLPYGTTQCKWDTVIPFAALWELLHTVCKPNGAIVMFGSEPFSSALRMSNIGSFKYDWIWLKDRPTGFLNAKTMPMSSHEVLSVFYKKPPIYNPQKWESKPMNTVRFGGASAAGNSTENYGKQRRIEKTELNSIERYPISYLKMNTVNGQAADKTSHPTQKPVALLEYLIKTYTNEGDTILDPTMGSGSTGVACRNMNRKFIGIEKEQKYFDIASRRITEDIVKK